MMPQRQGLEATLALLRRALGKTLRPGELTTIRKVPPERIVEVGSAHSILNLLGSVVDDAELQTVLDPDLGVFLREMRQRNRDRNAVLRRQLVEAGTLLTERGIPSVALKGGAELIAPVYPDPADRFLSDLDVLVPADRINDAIAALKDRGYTDNGATYRPHAIHAPALWHEAWPTAIELHTAVAEPQGDCVVTASDVFERALHSPALFPIATPTIADRLTHLVLHAQVHSNRHQGQWLLLRDMADLAVLSRDRATLQQVRDRFASTELMPLLESFLAAGETILADRLRTEPLSAAAEAWASRTLVLLGRPEVLRSRLLRHWLRHYGSRFFGNATLRQKYLRDLRDPDTVRRFLVRHWEDLRGFQ